MNKQELIEKYTGDVLQAIRYVESLRPEYLVRPTKPLLSIPHKSEMVKEYGEKLEVYEKEMIQYNLKKDHYKSTVNQQESELIEFMKDECGFYSNIPEKSREKVWSKAWSDGHSSGYYEVYQRLDELVDLF